jgi:hypothetical protein
MLGEVVDIMQIENFAEQVLLVAILLYSIFDHLQLSLKQVQQNHQIRRHPLQSLFYYH